MLEDILFYAALDSDWEIGRNIRLVCKSWKRFATKALFGCKELPKVVTKRKGYISPGVIGLDIFNQRNVLLPVDVLADDRPKVNLREFVAKHGQQIRSISVEFKQFKNEKPVPVALQDCCGITPKTISHIGLTPTISSNSDDEHADPNFQLLYCSESVVCWLTYMSNMPPASTFGTKVFVRIASIKISEIARLSGLTPSNSFNINIKLSLNAEPCVYFSVLDHVCALCPSVLKALTLHCSTGGEPVEYYLDHKNERAKFKYTSCVILNPVHENICEHTWTQKGLIENDEAVNHLVTRFKSLKEIHLDGKSFKAPVESDLIEALQRCKFIMCPILEKFSLSEFSDQITYAILPLVFANYPTIRTLAVGLRERNSPTGPYEFERLLVGLSRDRLPKDPAELTNYLKDKPDVITNLKGTVWRD